MVLSPSFVLHNSTINSQFFLRRSVLVRLPSEPPHKSLIVYKDLRNPSTSSTLTSPSVRVGRVLPQLSTISRDRIKETVVTPDSPYTLVFPSSSTPDLRLWTVSRKRPSSPSFTSYRFTPSTVIPASLYLVHTYHWFCLLYLGRPSGGPPTEPYRPTDHHD